MKSIGLRKVINTKIVNVRHVIYNLIVQYLSVQSLVPIYGAIE